MNPTPAAFRLPAARRLALAALLGAAAALPGAARAADFTWDGGGASDNWADGRNWVNDAVPPSSATTRLTFTGTTRLTPVQNIANPFTLSALTFDANAGAFTLGGSGVELSGEHRQRRSGASRAHPGFRRPPDNQQRRQSVQQPRRKRHRRGRPHPLRHCQRRRGSDPDRREHPDPLGHEHLHRRAHRQRRAGGRPQQRQRSGRRRRRHLQRRHGGTGQHHRVHHLGGRRDDVLWRGHAGEERQRHGGVRRQRGQRHRQPRRGRAHRRAGRHPERLLHQPGLLH